MMEPARIQVQKNMPEGPAKRAYLLQLKLPGTPIFNYHGLADSFSPQIPPAAQRFWLSPQQFRAHLAHVRRQGFHVALLEELKDALADAGQVGSSVLTFDDGLASDYQIAFPLLAEFGMKAVFFVNSSTVGQAGYLAWSQIVEMQRAGMSIQSHSHRHLDLTALPTEILEAELCTSKRQLEDHLGCPVDFLAAPHGLINRWVIHGALAAGYQAVCSTRCLPARPGSRVLTRITLHRDIQLEEFHGFLTGRVSSYATRLWRGLLYRPRRVAAHLSGVVRYRWLKQTVPTSK